MSGWVQELRAQVAAKGLTQVAQEIGYSRTSISQICNDKYGADPARIRDRVARVYGTGGFVLCPELGEILPERCAENHRKAKTIGLRAGSPTTLRLYKTCLNCAIRNDRKGS